jgi:hypothetical protein
MAKAIKSTKIILSAASFLELWGVSVKETYGLGYMNGLTPDDCNSLRRLRLVDSVI